MTVETKPTVPAVPTVKFSSDEERTKFHEFVSSDLPKILKETDYDELYGHQLTADGEFYNKDITDALVFKFLKANNFDLQLAKDQLTNTLKWRKKFKPLKAAFVESHDAKYQGIGMLTYYPDIQETITWNLYGESDEDHAKISPRELFEDLDAFLRYRIGLMERSLQLCKFDDVPLSKISQVHDYKGVSFLRFDAKVKAGSKAIIKIFQDFYPELLDKKYFVNVPILAQWIYDLVVMTWLPKETSRKFTMLSNAENLVGKIGCMSIPKKYGGQGGSLTTQNVQEVELTAYSKYLIESTYALEAEGETIE